MGALQQYRRDIALFAFLAALFALVFSTQGAAYSLRLTVEATCYAILALGLSLQWGTAGLFNVGVMGFIAAGAFTSVLVTFPVNDVFWAGDGPALLGNAGLKAAIGILAIWAARKTRRFGFPGWLVNLLTLVAVAATYLVVTAQIDIASGVIEKDAEWIGGFGLPVFVGWAAAGLVAGIIAWFVGKICLGLRSDYLAIATLGIAQIIKTFLKNADWLTHGTLTVSPLPWPVPGAGETGFEVARATYLSITAVMLVVVYLLLERAWHAPWGRMMRAIRDNEDAAASMGKDVNRRRLEIFIFGSMLMGIGGAALIHFNTIFDPSGFIDLNHTFLVWVMVILGGAGNNRGAIFGALFVYVVWTMSEPLSLAIFHQARDLGHAWFGWVAPDDLDSRAISMRVFIIGLTIALVLRYAPNGVLPEKLSRKG